MSNACEGSPAEDPSSISLDQPCAESMPAEPGPEGEASSEVERENSDIQHPHENEPEQSSMESASVGNESTQATPVKRFVIADSDDDVTDEEDGAQRAWNNEGRAIAGDHDYATPCEPKNANKVESPEAFPVLPGLAELGIVSDDLDMPSEQHIPSGRVPATHMGYEQREPNIINRSPAAVRDGGVYRATEGQGGYLARPARSTIQASSGYRGVQVAPDRALPHTAQQHQQQPHFFVAGYNGAPVARRVMTAAPITGSSMVQKRTAPRIVSTPTQIRLPSQRMSGSAPHVSMQQPSQRQSSTVVAAPPVQRQVDPPPHRSFHQGPDTSHRVVLVSSGNGSRVAFSPADPSQAALANAPAPLLVTSRGTRPVVRGRGGSVTGRAKKESTSGVSGEEASPAHSPQATPRIPLNTPLHGSRTTPASPRKQVHFSDGVAVGPGAGGTPSPLRMQGMPPTSLHPDVDSPSHQPGIRSPSRLTSARIRAPAPSVAPHAAAPAPTASITSPPRTIHTTSPETPPLPENFVDDAEPASQSYTESEENKNSTLPPEVIAAATSLSAETDMNHPQWTNNDISAEDIKAKIEAISREIAQEMEQKKMESEAQARERKRPGSDVSTVARRRSGTETHFSGGEEMEAGGPSAGAPRGRGRPRGSGRTRSSLSSSSNTSLAATGTTPLHHDISEGPYGAARAVDYQSSRVAGRSSVRGNVAPITAYDGSMAPELPPPLPPISSAQTLRGTYQQSPGLAQSPQTVQRTPLDHGSPLSPGYPRRGVNGLSPEDDLANVSTDPSSDEEEAAEEAEWGDYVTRCLCEMQHNDEWMVECEQCNVWQHMKCMGIDPKKFNQNDTYLCEYCKPRPLKWTKKQAQELQLKQLKAVSREKERKMAEKLRRREERKRAKLNQRLKERNHAKTAAKRGPAAFKKFQMISRNEYTKRAKQMLALFDTTAGAQSILENSRDLKRGKRMFVAPDIEGLVSTEAIKQDDVIMEYVGHVCLPDECPGRLQRGALQPYCVLYNGLGQNLLCIDARRQGSDARFARRCCRSNSTLKHVLLNGSIYVMLVASERIEKGTEVTIPFDCDFRDTLVPVECACGDDPNCYMKQFNNSLRGKASFEERPNHDVAPQQPQASNGTASGRRAAATPHKTKTENRGRPKGSGKKEKVAEETPRKKGPGGRKPKKVGIRLRRHSDSKNTKSSDESMEQAVEADAAEKTEEKAVEEKNDATEKEKTSGMEEAQAAEAPPTVPAPSVESAAVEVKAEEKPSVTTNEQPAEQPPASPKKPASEGNKSAPTSPKKEEQQPSTTAGRRRSSTGSGRLSKREAIEQLKEVMDYTLPEDRNKPSREERKLQAALAAIERKEEKEKRRAEAHKDSSDVKEKRGPGRPARSSTGGGAKAGKRSSERHNDKDKDKKADKDKKVEKKVEPVVEPSVRESPRVKKKREDFKENEVDEVSTVAQPPRKRWAAAVKENEAAQRASSPEVTSSSSATSTGAGDVSSADSVNPSSVGGKKLWLRRHAAESISEESVQAADTAASSEPLTCAADSTSDIATLPSRIQMSPPLKKRRHMLEACQSDEHVAATALAQMGAKAEGFRFHWNMALRYLMPNLNESLNVDFDLAESVRKPLPLPSVRKPVTTLPSVSVEATTATSTSSQVPTASSSVEVRKAKRLSLEDYKRRRSTMGSSDNTTISSGATTTQTTTTGNLADLRNRSGESNSRPTRSFIPTMDTSLDQSALLRPLDSSIPIPPLGVPPDLEVVKKMILEESCIPSPPVPPSLPQPVETPASSVPASTSDMSIGSTSESGEERMSLADRLAKEFGVGTAGTPRSPKPVLSSGHRAMPLRDVPPPPPPGPRPTRNTRW